MAPQAGGSRRGHDRRSCVINVERTSFDVIEASQRVAAALGEMMQMLAAITILPEQTANSVDSP